MAGECSGKQEAGRSQGVDAAGGQTYTHPG